MHAKPDPNQAFYPAFKCLRAYKAGTNYPKRNYMDDIQYGKEPAAMT